MEALTMETYWNRNGEFIILGGSGPIDGAVKFDSFTAFETAKQNAAKQQKNPEGLLTALYGDSDYIALMDKYSGRIASFEKAISDDRLQAALTLWRGFDVSTALIDTLKIELAKHGYDELLTYIS